MSGCPQSTAAAPTLLPQVTLRMLLPLVMFLE
jgi:hypothetical protein